VETYPFLSDEWMEAARRIRAEFAGRATTPPPPVRMNLVIKDAPGREGPLHAHLDGTSGEMLIELGHLENPDLTLTTDAETVRQVFVEGNAQAGMQAFMSGKVQVTGDMTKLMAMQATPPDPITIEVQQRLKEITQ
jgi:putative sterol carrier protein